MNETCDALSTNGDLLPWHQAMWSRYRRLADERRLPHALLMAGIPGVGKRMFANWLARYVLCQSPVAGMPCDACHACHLSLAQTHPDLRRVSPEEKSSVIKIEQIRDCHEFVMQSGQQGHYKVVLFDPAEVMMRAAANALLKTLEEPPAKTLLILITDCQGLLLPTIRSRCQVVDFAAPPQDQGLSWLAQRYDSADAQVALQLHANAPLKAGLALEQGEIERTKVMTDALASLLKRQLLPSEVAQSWLKLVGEPETLIRTLVSWMQATIRYAATRETHRLDWLPGHAIFRYLAEKNDARRLFLVQDEMMEALDFLQRSNPNATLLIERLLYSWLELMPRKGG